MLFTLARFELVPLDGLVGTFFELCASVGGGVVIGLMVFAFFNKHLAIAAGVIATFVAAPFAVGFLRDYTVLLSSLTAYGVSAAVCTAMSLRNKQRFDFSTLAERVTSFQNDRAAFQPRPATQQPPAHAAPART